MVTVVVRGESAATRTAAAQLAAHGFAVRIASARDAAGAFADADALVCDATAMPIDAAAPTPPAIVAIGAVAAGASTTAFECVADPVALPALLAAVHRAAAHTRALRERDQARAQLRDLCGRLHEISASASTLAHELRNPATGITQALRAVADRLGVANTTILSEFRERLQRIDAMLARCFEFVQPIELRRSAIDPAELLAAAAGAIDRHRWPQLQVTVAAPTRLPTVPGDRARLEQALATLIEHAAGRCGGQGHVTLSASAEFGHVCIDVADDGPAIPALQAERAFLLFHAGKSGGLSAGLATPRKIATAHGGSLMLVDRSGQGACFRLDLPTALRSDDAEPT